LHETEMPTQTKDRPAVDLSRFDPHRYSYGKGIKSQRKGQPNGVNPVYDVSPLGRPNPCGSAGSTSITTPANIIPENMKSTGTFF